MREAAACGLGSVLIAGSCAAEGVTDGRNGFLIEETPASLAALLERVGADLPLLHTIGERAMEEIYVSWRDAVAAAYARYGEVLELKRAGALPEKRKQPTDLFYSIAAKNIEEQERRRQIWSAMLESFRESAVGMMENMHEAGESVGSLRERLRQEFEDLRKR